jgi:hypothetical protein
MTPKVGDARSGVRVAASLLWRSLVAVAGLHAYWALGGTWAIHEAAATKWERFAVGPFVVALALLSLIVACAGGEWGRTHQPHRTLPSH